MFSAFVRGVTAVALLTVRRIPTAVQLVSMAAPKSLTHSICPPIPYLLFRRPYSSSPGPVSDSPQVPEPSRRYRDTDIYLLLHAHMKKLEVREFVRQAVNASRYCELFGGWSITRNRPLLSRELTPDEREYAALQFMNYRGKEEGGSYSIYFKQLADGQHEISIYKLPFLRLSLDTPTPPTRYSLTLSKENPNVSQEIVWTHETREAVLQSDSFSAIIQTLRE